MGLRSWWNQYQLTRARRLLAAHPDLALTALRQSPDLGLAAVTAYWDRQVSLAAATQPDRKTAPWPILNQLGHGARHALTQTLPKATPYNLRRFSEYPPARRAINAITNPLVELAWQIRKIPDPDNPKAEPSLEERVQMALATRLLTTPNDDDSWRTFMEAVLEDIVVGGYGAIEVGQTDDPLRPLYLWPVDGQSIRINANWDPAYPDEPRYSQALAYVGMSVGTHERVELRDDELIYLKLNPRTNTPFGLGYLEVAFSTINAWLGSMEHAERVASNAIPNVAIFLGEHVDLTAARAWRAYWQEQIEGYGQVPILGGGPKPEVMDLRGTGTDQLFLKWQEFLIRLIAISFGLSPLTLGIERDVNRCYDEETEVLTFHGWKHHDALTLDDLVATVHPVTQELYYVRPKQIYRYRYNGSMIRYANAFTDVCVTPNHRLWVAKYPRTRAAWRQNEPAEHTYGFCEAGALGRLGRRFTELKAVRGIFDPIELTIDTIEIPRVPYGDTGWRDPDDLTVPIEPFLRFLGYFISEGGLYTKRPGRTYLWTLAQKPGPVADKIRETLARMPCRVHESFTERDGCVRWTCTGKSLYTYLLQECGHQAPSKRIPLWIKHLPRHQLRIFFDALMEGDGSWSKKTTPGFNGYYSTTSSQLADDVQEIAMKLGYRAQKHQHRHKKAPYHHDLYRVMMTQTEEAGFYHANVQSVPYDGIVWCVDVPPHHLFVTRRNGKIGIHGNSTSQTEDVQDWDSIKPVAGTVKDYLDRRLLWKTLGFTTLEFEW